MSNEMIELLKTIINGAEAEISKTDATDYTIVYLIKALTYDVLKILIGS